MVQSLGMCFANIELDLTAYLEHAICTKLPPLPTWIDIIGISFTNLTRTDVAKPGVIPVVSATMGEAAHLVCADSCSLSKSKFSNNDTIGSPRAYTANPGFTVRAWWEWPAQDADSSWRRCDKHSRDYWSCKGCGSCWRRICTRHSAQLLCEYVEGKPDGDQEVFHRCGL